MHMKRALRIKNYAAAEGLAVHIVPISMKTLPPRRLSDLRIHIDPTWTIDPERPSVLIMTSGTTGPSKAVIHGRKLFSLAYSFLEPGDVFLVHRSSAWIAGLTPLVSGVLRGAQLEIVSRDIRTIWDRFRSGRITVFYSVPSVWSALMDYYQGTISNLSPKLQRAYRQGLSHIRLANVTGGSLLPHVRRFWTDELQIPLAITYAATELGGLATMRNPCPFPDDKVRGMQSYIGTFLC
jgi:malonyl-CoA/methylmalonyl-CoA synthetase